MAMAVHEGSEASVTPTPWAGRASRRASFVIVSVGYLAVTCGEALLAPVFPIAAREFGLGLREEGFALSLLAFSIALGNVLGGLILSLRGPRSGAALGLAMAAAGSGLIAASRAWPTFLLAQALLGFGSGLFFASGLSAAAALSRGRPGLATGLFGVAFSAGLGLAALLVIFTGSSNWRFSYIVASMTSVGAGGGILVASLPARRALRRRISWSGVRGLGAPLIVGGMAAVSQYGTISFLPAFAVGEWGMTPSAAAMLLAIARVLSIPGKVSVGRRADRIGGLVTAGRIGLVLAVLGAWWTLVPGLALAGWAAVAFATGVSALGPLGNVLALEAFVDHEHMLGVFRSLQIGLGAAAGAVLGLASAQFGLRVSLVVAAVAPGALRVMSRRLGSDRGHEAQIVNRPPNRN